MNILVTGARGFVGKNLVAALQNIRDGKDRTHSELDIREIYKYNTDGSPEQLADYAKSADFVFHLAGVNRPETAGRITTPPWRPSATTLRTTCRSQSMTLQRSWSWSTLMILSRNC